MTQSDSQNRESTFARFYPDLRQDGGLKQGLQNRLQLLSSALTVGKQGADGYAAVAKDGRAISVYYADDKRLFFANFSGGRRDSAQGQTDCLLDVAKAAEMWVTHRASVIGLQEAFAFVWRTRYALSADASAEEIIETEWQDRQRTIPEDHLPLVPLWNRVKESVMLRRLLPVTSHHTLLFSRCTDYPFSEDCRYAVPTLDGRYEVLLGFGPTVKRLGTGDAVSAVRLLEEHLPHDWMTVTKGTRYAL